MKITIEGYPVTFTFEYKGKKLPAFEYAEEKRQDLLVKAMEAQEVKSPSHAYGDYVIEEAVQTKTGETWWLGS